MERLESTGHTCEIENQRNTVMNKLVMKGNWNIAKGKLKQKWAELTDNDLRYVEGQEEELIGRIQKRTGESREAIEKAFEEAFHE
jgi:uncharacterized protein YjbJ (UPF0337 family)